MNHRAMNKHYLQGIFDGYDESKGCIPARCRYGEVCCLWQQGCSVLSVVDSHCNFSLPRRCLHVLASMRAWSVISTVGARPATDTADDEFVLVINRRSIVKSQPLHVNIGRILVGSRIPVFSP